MEGNEPILTDQSLVSVKEPRPEVLQVPQEIAKKATAAASGHGLAEDRTQRQTKAYADRSCPKPDSLQNQAIRAQN